MKKIKITCSKEAKNIIISALAKYKDCCFIYSHCKIKCQDYYNCNECIEKNIEWDGEGR